MPLHPTACPLDCPDTCGVLVETDDQGRVVRLKGNPDHSWSKGALCGKTAIYHELVNGSERLQHPLIRRGETFERATWDEALDLVASKIQGLGPELLALSYAGHMGLVNRRFPSRLMNVLGATETDGTICDTTSTLGFERVIGHVVGPDLEQVTDADFLVLWGCDARRTIQHLMPRVKALCERGVPVVVIDVYRTDTVQRIESWGGKGLIVRPGTDAALALGLVELAFQRGSADLEFLKRECHGAAEFRAEVAGQYPLDKVAEWTGLDKQDIQWLSDRFAEANDAWIKTGVGWNRRRHGGQSMRAVCSLGAVLGIADRVHFESVEHFGLEDDVLHRRDLRPEDAAEAISQVGLGKVLEEGRFKAAVVWGHNPAMTVPDSVRVRDGLARDDLFLVVHDVVMTETAMLADVVLPATTLPEHTDVFRSYGHRVLQVGRKCAEAPGEQRSNVDTFAALAKKLGFEGELWDVTEESLLEDFLTANRSRFTDEEWDQVRAGEPVKLTPRTFADRGTPSGKIELVSETCEAEGAGRIACFVSDTGTSRGRFWFHSAPSVATHNSTYSTLSRHQARNGEPRVFVNPEDAEELGLNGRARVIGEGGSLTLAVERTEDLPRGMVRVDGFPDSKRTPEGLSTNALTVGVTSDLGGGTAQFSTKVDLEPA